MENGKKILILGAGRSSSSLIEFLLNQAEEQDWIVFVGDVDEKMAQTKCAGHPRARTFAIDPNDSIERDEHIRSSDVVVSMVPAFLHAEIAEIAIEAGVSVVTPSYVSPEMERLHARAVEKGVLVLNEVGLDPGIDHLSAKMVLDRIESEGGKILEFESYCGGLIAPASDNNPWHYKFSWNPRNVVLAGQGGSATFLAGGQERLVPPHRVFQNPRMVEVGGSVFEGYPNRDSVAYVEKYGLQGVQTLIRGTLRGNGFCAGWDALVQLGCVRDDAVQRLVQGTSWAEWTRSFLPAEMAHLSLVDAVSRVTGASGDALEMLRWLGLFDEVKGPELTTGTPAQIIQSLLEVKWELGPEDRDMIVMWHRFVYGLNGRNYEITSSLKLEGRDSVYTGMSDTVGWPVALAAAAILDGTFKQVGVQVPLDRGYYEVMLPALERMGVIFQETHREC